jgi:hypothetical protein
MLLDEDYELIISLRILLIKQRLVKILNLELRMIKFRNIEL